MNKFSTPRYTLGNVCDSAHYVHVEAVRDPSTFHLRKLMYQCIIAGLEQEAGKT